MAATITIEDMTLEEGATIGAGVRKAVFGINMTDPDGDFTGLTVELADHEGDGDFELATLEDLAPSPDGVAVYRDSSRTGANEDNLDGGDSRVSTGFVNTNGSVDITVSSAIPTAVEGDFTYFLAVESSTAIDTGDDFTVEIPSVLLSCAFETSPATSFLNCPTGTSQPIVAEADAPTATILSTPTSIDGNVVWQFSENVVGVSEENVVLRRVSPSAAVPADVTYSSTTRRATINPDGNLVPGASYVTTVNPTSATNLVTDQAGNPVAETEEFFTLPQMGSTPGIVRGNLWFLNNDFDGDHDVPAFAYGSSTDFPIVGDWDGDGVVTPGIVRGNAWHLSNNLDGIQDEPTFTYGRATDIPLVGDWNGDGTWTPGVVRGNSWHLSNNLDGVQDIPTFGFGRATDFPIVGNWDGIGGMSPGVVRGNAWHLTNTFNGVQSEPTISFGSSTDFPIVGDWDGDLSSTPGVVRGNTWLLNDDLDPFHDIAVAYGRSTDYPIAGDWDGSIGS